jgi:hypothetical protein
VDLRGGLDDLKKRKFLTAPELELRLLSRPAPSLKSVANIVVSEERVLSMSLSRV